MSLPITRFYIFPLLSLEAVTRGAEWSGRLCCPSAVTPRCQNSCATSSSKREASRGCRQSDEQHLYSCFERQDVGDECCGSARTSECLQACRDIFQSQKTASREQRLQVEQACNDNNTNFKVLSCVREFTDLTPITNSKQCEFQRSVRSQQRVLKKISFSNRSSLLRLLAITGLPDDVQEHSSGGRDDTGDN